ncbi:hypothetical protein BJV82DRAFT_527730 [Fennellomyces sp. T-0311]|nr:hypothetical protein BJV82DRAFT_527730 [Fennellomyces sp. T-0311]
MDTQCAGCGARVWPWEDSRENQEGPGRIYHVCCSYGIVDLPPIPAPPQPLFNLLNRSDPTSNQFFNDIRKYNSAFAFASLGATIDNNYTNARGGAYAFRIQGGIYHRIGPLLPDGAAPPAFAQIYIYDSSEQQVNRRSDIFES